MTFIPNSSTKTDFATMTRSRWCLTLLILSMTLLVGCGERAVDRLIGRWEGQPDSASKLDGRRGQQPESNDQEPKAGDEAKDSDVPSKRATLLENYDFRLLLEFVDQEHVVMSLDDGSEKKHGDWQLIENIGDQLLIQITTPGNDSKDESPKEIRRFTLELERNPAGFTLTEEGTAAQFGWMFFRRVEK